jgi:flagellar biosynthesis anti-sigma factor FlgM
MDSVKLNGTPEANLNRVSERAETNRVTETDASASTTAAGSPSGLDRIEFSGRAAEVARLTAQVAQLPDLRQERVAQLRAQVQANAYQADVREVAGAILNQDFGF